MRKALLVVTLVLASFGGGAFVNGPGLNWLKGALGLEPRPLENLGGDAPPEFAEAPVVSVGPEPAVEEPAVAEMSAAPAVIEASAAPAAMPAPAPAPAVAETPQGEMPQRVASSVEGDSEGPTPPPLEAPGRARVAAGIPLGVPTRQTAPMMGGEARAETEPASAREEPEPGWGDAPGSAPAVAVVPRSRVGGASRRDPQISGVSMPAGGGKKGSIGGETEAETPGLPGAGVPALGVPGGSAPSTAPAAAKAGAGGDGSNWGVMREAMTKRGVTRFWVEGEPSGVVTFRCVVPVAGRGAIAQQFEAQGEDVEGAAEAALKRIDLWRATERR